MNYLFAFNIAKDNTVFMTKFKKNTDTFKTLINVRNILLIENNDTKEETAHTILIALPDLRNFKEKKSLWTLTVTQQKRKIKQRNIKVLLRQMRKIIPASHHVYYQIT